MSLHPFSKPLFALGARPPQFATLPQRIAFYHAALFSPALSTLCKALDAEYLTTWPELTSALVRKYPPQSRAMIEGHLDQQRVDTATSRSQGHRRINNLPFPHDNRQSTSLSQRTNAAYPAIISLKHHAYSDQTGRFPGKSRKGNEYLFVLYDYDSNTIDAEPIPNRLGLTIKRACQKLLAKLHAKGLQTKLYTLDNEASRLLRDFLTSEGAIPQLVAPYVHRRNAAERSIRTFKNHFLAGLASADPAFPLDLWDLLLPQATMTLNLLRGSRINPSLSAYAQINGLLDFTKTPLAPPGIRTLVHEKPGQRNS